MEGNICQPFISIQYNFYYYLPSEIVGTFLLKDRSFVDNISFQVCHMLCLKGTGHYFPISIRQHAMLRDSYQLCILRIGSLQRVHMK